MQLTIELLTNGIALEKDGYFAFYTMFNECKLDAICSENGLIACIDDNPSIYRSFSSYANIIQFEAEAYYCKTHSRLLDDNNQCDICVSEKF